MSIVIVARVDKDTLAGLDYLKHEYRVNRSLLINEALTLAVFNAVANKVRVRGRIKGDTSVVGCRVSQEVAEFIKEYCCRRINDTACTWVGLALQGWVKEALKENKRQQRRSDYRWFVSNYADSTRQDLAGLQSDIAEYSLKG